MSFDLDALVDDQVAANPHSRIDDIADRVAEKVPDGELRHLLKVTLRSKIKRALAIRLGAMTGTRHGEDRLKAPRSARGATSSDLLKENVSVERGKWKALGSCTARDLRAMAAFRQTLIVQHTGMAERFERLAEAVEAHDAARVSDLSATYVHRLIGPDQGGAQT